VKKVIFVNFFILSNMKVTFTFIILCVCVVLFICLVSSPEPKTQVSYCHCNLSGVRPSVFPSVNLFPLNDFFSRTTGPISTKLDGNHAWGMGIQICSNKGAGPFWVPIRSKIRTMMINLKKSSSHGSLV